MKPWMIAALLGALMGLFSRRWLAVDVGRGQTFDHNIPPDKKTPVIVTVVVGIGNTVNYNRPPVSTLISSSDKESSHAEGA